VQDLTEIDPTHFAAVFETRIAYMKFKFNVTVEMTRAEAPDLIEGKIEGKPLGLVGRLTATALTRLTDDGDATKIAYEIDSALTGKLGSMGQPVLKAKAKEMEKQFAERLKARFEPSPPSS
jgi:carbon monoxide dehydrogenase subunit G